jgi:hypothetical protein
MLGFLAPVYGDTARRQEDFWRSKVNRRFGRSPALQGSARNGRAPPKPPSGGAGRRRVHRRLDAQLSRPVRRMGDRHPGRRLRRLGAAPADRRKPASLIRSPSIVKRGATFPPWTAVEIAVDPPQKTDNFLTRSQSFFICSHTAVLKEKAECPVPLEAVRLPLATGRSGPGADSSASGRKRSKCFLIWTTCNLLKSTDSDE